MILNGLLYVLNNFYVITHLRNVYYKYIFKHSAFCSNTGCRTSVNCSNCSRRIANSNMLTAN
ncbi:hypothetical protein C0J52_14131 [Blattella germanica]|nr:hypothetical protein C0J52_14131 [Blattella germanica]